MGDRPRILLSSGWAIINIGDIGHTPGSLRFLEEYWPEARVTLWLSHANQAVLSMLRRRFPNVPIVRGDINAAGEANDTDLRQAFAVTDLVIWNSGMAFNRFWPPPVDRVKMLLDAGKPFALFGQSFDGFEPADEPAFADLLSHAASITCRDNESYYYLRRIGAKPGRLAFGPDGCLGIDVRDDAAAGPFLRDRGLAHKQFITVTIRTNTAHAHGGNSLNPAVPTPAQVAEDEARAEKLREIIVTWVRTTGLRVLLAPEVEKELAHARRLIYDRLPDDVRPRVAQPDTFWNVDVAASVYAAARVVVSMEPHSCIIAMANGTPVLHYCTFKHGVKAWMFRDLGLPEWLLDIDALPASVCVGELMTIHEHYDVASARVTEAMSLVHSRAAEAIRHLKARG